MSRERLLLYLLLLVYGIVGGLFAVLTPAWQVPDEPAHYNYIRQLVERRRCCPVIEPGDWDQAYLDEIKAARFDPALLDNLEAIQYEDHQPPLYYQMAAFFYRWSGGNLIAVRLFSVLLGAGVVWCAYALSKTLLPDRPGVALGAAAFVAFLPQHVAMLAGVNNDSLVELLIGLVLVLLARYLLVDNGQTRRLGVVLLVVALGGLTLLLIGGLVPSAVGAMFLALVAVGALWPRLAATGDWQVWAIGMLVALIFATKATGYFIAGVVLLALYWRWRHDGWRAVGWRLAYFLVPALVLGGLWWARNISTYGFPDFLGLGAHDLVVTGQPRTADYLAQVGAGAYLNDALQTTFRSFWGQFGWMALPLQPWMYTALLALTLFAGGGLVVDRLALNRGAAGAAETKATRPVWALLWLVIGLTLLMYGYYNSEFLQLQGRYLYPALLPVALLLAVGVDAWRRWLLPGAGWAQWLPLALFGLLAPFDVYLILRVIRPLLLP